MDDHADLGWSWRRPPEKWCVQCRAMTIHRESRPTNDKLNRYVCQTCGLVNRDDFPIPRRLPPRPAPAPPTSTPRGPAPAQPARVLNLPPGHYILTSYNSKFRAQQARCICGWQCLLLDNKLGAMVAAHLLELPTAPPSGCAPRVERLWNGWRASCPCGWSSRRKSVRSIWHQCRSHLARRRRRR